MKRQYILGGALSLAFMLLVAAALLRSDLDQAFSGQWAAQSGIGGQAGAVSELTMGQPRALGAQLFQTAVLPFELTSLLLLLAILGALMVARDVRSEGKQDMPEFAAVVHAEVDTAAPVEEVRA